MDLLQYLHITYDLVRYVDPIRKKIIHVEARGTGVGKHIQLLRSLESKRRV